MKYPTTAAWALGSMLMLALAAGAEPREHRDHREFEFRSGQLHAPRGVELAELPRGAYEARLGGRRYWYHGGSWYAPRGVRWVVAAPPYGILVPFLPDMCATLWWGGVPYYYANDVYYLWRENRHAYEVVPPPEGSPEVAPSPDVIAYPREGQDDERQAEDRYQCHRWASEQTHFDPTKPGGGVGQHAPAVREDYLRALSACLEGRGYTVK